MTYYDSYGRRRTPKFSTDRAVATIRKAVEQYGATGFLFGTSDGLAILGFQLQNRTIRIRFTLPRQEDFRLTPKGTERTAIAARKEHEKATARYWQTLANTVKAKLEAVDAKLSTLDDEFLAFILLDNKNTVGDALRDGVAKAYFGDKAPQLLPAFLGVPLPSDKSQTEIDDSRFQKLG